MRTVMCTLNGQLRPVPSATGPSPAEVTAAEKADRSDPGHVAAPFAGVVTLTVAEGDKVAAGDTGRHHRGDEDGGRDHRPRAGTVSRVAIGPVQQVEGGDLLAVVNVAEETGPE